MAAADDPTGLAPALAETHVSVLVFLGDRAYKLKKPVDLGFLDFRRREVREAACHRETELNRRLSPDVYLGVADVIGPDGELADHLVVMRRMPEERRLSALVLDGDPGVPEQLRALARLLAGFHSRAERSPAIDRAGSADAVLANWRENFEQMRPFTGSVLPVDAAHEVAELVERFVAGRRQLFDDRIAQGHVCDGHGDLQADDIFCLDDGPRVLDCLEFADRYRHGDVLADVAFLAMDLDRLGAPDLGASFLRWYREHGGDVAPPSLVEHYVAYRAHVRCKVNCFRLEQTDDAEARAEVEREARRLLQMVRRYLQRARVRLVLVGGLPGTGKSTLARNLGERLGWTVLRSDEVRKELAGLPADARASGPYGEGLYAPDVTDRVYETLLERARLALARGESVVLDASWSDARQRDRARTVAEEAHADLEALECQAPPDVAAARIDARLERGDDASDATPDVARRMGQAWDVWPEAATISTDGPPGDALERALDVLQASSAAGDVAR